MDSRIIKKFSVLAAVAICLVSVSLAGTVVWDGEAGDGLWSSALNWNPNNIPVSGDTVIISNGTTVTSDIGNWPGGMGVILSGGSDLTESGGVVRMGGSSLHVGPGSTLSGNFWDLLNATIVFDDGAAADMSNFEMKGVNTFIYNLSPTGFAPTLTPGTFRNDGNNTNTPATLISNDTFIVDVALYQGNGGTFTLMDFGADAEGMDNTVFQNAMLYVSNFGTRTTSLYWDDAEEAIKIYVSPVKGTVVLLK